MQGAASLRQALHQIRQSFGPHRDVIGANRQDVWLDQGGLRVERDARNGEFLEGMDVRDDEFERWLSGQRAACDPWVGGSEAAMAPVPPEIRNGDLTAAVFSMSRDGLKSAERRIEQGIARGQTGHLHALMAQTLVNQAFEKLCEDPASVNERIEYHTRMALALEPTDATVLAVASHCKGYLDRDVDVAGELALMAVRADPDAPLPWWALANAFQYGGKPARALHASVNSQRTAEGTRLRFWADMQRSTAELALGNIRSAARYAELSSLFKSEFRHPLRYLIALYARLGDRQRAHAMVRKLKALEPGFSVPVLWQDGDYPVELLRRAGILEGCLGLE